MDQHLKQYFCSTMAESLDFFFFFFLNELSAARVLPAEYKTKHLLSLPICTEGHTREPGYCSLYAPHVQKQLLSNEADIICPYVL